MPGLKRNFLYPAMAKILSLPLKQKAGLGFGHPAPRLENSFLSSRTD
jgi:hypothetical protein